LGITSPASDISSNVLCLICLVGNTHSLVHYVTTTVIPRETKPHLDGKHMITINDDNTIHYGKIR
jgi:hypothetical protein